MSAHFTRKPNRLSFKKLYQSEHWYFVTICTQDKKCIFVEASLSRHDSDQNKLNYNFINNKFTLNQYGKEIEKSWLNLTNIFKGIYLDEYTIMPNHFHAIISFGNQIIQMNTNKTVDLGQVISRFKNDSRKKVVDVYEKNVEGGLSFYNIQNGETGSPLRIDGFNPYKFWQKSFYDHIIRDEKDFDRIREYIIGNPLSWHLDSLNPINLKNND